MKKKVVMVVEAMLGGVRRHVCDLVENLSQEKFEIYIIYSGLRADEGFYKSRAELEKHAELICCNEMRRSLGKEDFAAYREIVKILKRIRPDIVHCHSSKAGVAGRLAAKRCKVSLILYTPHAYAFQTPKLNPVKKIVYVYAEKLLSKYATSLTINVSRGELKTAQSFRIDKPSKFRLIYNGIPHIELKEKMQIRRELGLDENTYYIGAAARCSAQKDPFTFLRVAKKVIQENPGIEFVYIGEGGMKDAMERWIVENAVEGKIHMLGFRVDAAEIVGAFDLYFSTALYEGLPYSIMEAMRAGVPIIATDVAGNSELVFEGKNGRLFPAGDINEAYSLIMRQYTGREIKPRDVKNTFGEKFSLRMMVKKMEQVYES